MKLATPLRTAFASATLSAALVAGAVGAVGATAAPAPAQAAPAPAAAPTSLAALAGGSSNVVDSLGRPTPQVQRAVTDFANRPGTPPQVRDALLAGLAFLTGSGGGNAGPGLPESGPAFRQGLWPTISPNCMGPGMNSTGSLIAVPGPARIPVPAPKAGQATFVFTALGTKPASPQQGAMNVHWVNLATLRTGVTPLRNNGINPTGPATLSNVADTGSGPVLAVVSGAVKTDGRSCGFAPTALSVTVK